MLMKFEVGKPFPDTRYRAHEGGIIMLNEVGFDVLIILRGLQSQEVRNFRKGDLTYGVADIESVPFIMMLFNKSFDLDLSLNVKGFRHLEDRKKWLDSEANLVSIYLVDGTTYNLRAIRAVGLNLDFAARVKEISRIQEQRYRNKADVDQVISQTKIKYSLKDILRKVEKRYTIKKRK